MRGEPGAGPGHELGYLLQGGGGTAALASGDCEGVFAVELGQHRLEGLERRLALGVLSSGVLLPVPPPADEVPGVAPPVAVGLAIGPLGQPVQMSGHVELRRDVMSRDLLPESVIVAVGQH